MTWREFQLRRFGYLKKQKEEWCKVREIAYWSGAGTAFEANKVSIDKFMPLKDEASKEEPSKESRDIFKKLQKEYLKKVENGR